MSPILAEIIGTAILLLLGCGVVANVVLSKTKGQNSGWIVITWGWAIAVFVAVFTMGQFSGAHINPAVTIGLATAGLFDWSMVLPYILAQTFGAFLGSAIAWVSYKDHLDVTDDVALKLAVFSTSPAIRNYPRNIISEAIGTFVLMFAILYITEPGFISSGGEMLSEIVINGEAIGFGLGSLSALPVALLVLGIGLCLGGPTGYAINPARDLGPRVAHFILPISNKGGSDWAYAWVPVLGPILGAAVAAGLYLIL